MWPEMIAQRIRKQFMLCNSVCVIPRQLMRVFGVFTKVPYEGAKLHKKIPARKPCVTDVLCNWEINTKMIKNMCLIILGPIVVTLFHAGFGKACGEVHSEIAPLQAMTVCCALCSTQQNAFRWGKSSKRCRDKGRKRGGQQRGQKGKKDA